MLTSIVNDGSTPEKTGRALRIIALCLFDNPQYRPLTFVGKWRRYHDGEQWAIEEDIFELLGCSEDEAQHRWQNVMVTFQVEPTPLAGGEIMMTITDGFRYRWDDEAVYEYDPQAAAHNRALAETRWRLP